MGKFSARYRTVSAVVVDTHIAIWMLFASQRLSAPSLAAIEEAVEAGEPVYIAAISLVEITYLVEKGRLQQEVLEKINHEIGDPAEIAVAHTLSIPRIPRRFAADFAGARVDRDPEFLASTLSRSYSSTASTTTTGRP